MITRRTVVTGVAAILAADIPSINAQGVIFKDGDLTWYSTGMREKIIELLTAFFDHSTAYLPVSGFKYDGSGNYPILDQFLLGFGGAPRPVESLPDGRWLFSGSVAKQPSMMSFVVMSSDQSRIEASMMSYMLCPAAGVDFVDPANVSHKIKCEIDPGWAIFVSRYENQNVALISELKKVASKYAVYFERPFINQGLRDVQSVNAKAVVIKVP